MLVVIDVGFGVFLYVVVVLEMGVDVVFVNMVIVVVVDLVVMGLVFKLVV